MSVLKLFVVGESSDDPERWDGSYGSRAIVIARDGPEAEMLAERRPATEIRMDRPMLVLTQEILSDS
jgi:hypothetical protein